MKIINTKNLVVVCALLTLLTQHVSAAPGKKETVKKTEPKLYLIDTIQAVVYSDEATDVITLSDISRTGLDGTQRHLEDLVYAFLMYRDAVKFKMVPDEEMVDSYLKTLQRTHNLTLDQIKEMFANAGYTYEEGRQELAMLNTVNTVLDFKVRSRMIVPQKDIVAFYEANPIMEPASYQLERAVALKTAAESKDELKEKIMNNECDLAWSEPFWIMKGDIAADKQFIMALKVDEISEPQEIAGGFELFRLKQARPEHLVPLEDRVLEISNTLRRPRYEQMMDEYKQELMDGASIVWFDEKDVPA